MNLNLHGIEMQEKTHPPFGGSQMAGGH